jgi:hypothetical protein
MSLKLILILVLFMLYMFIEYFCPDEAVKFCETLTNNKQERTQQTSFSSNYLTTNPHENEQQLLMVEQEINVNILGLWIIFPANNSQKKK